MIITLWSPMKDIYVCLSLLGISMAFIAIKRHYNCRLQHSFINIIRWNVEVAVKLLQATVKPSVLWSIYEMLSAALWHMNTAESDIMVSIVLSHINTLDDGNASANEACIIHDGPSLSLWAEKTLAWLKLRITASYLALIAHFHRL